MCNQERVTERAMERAMESRFEMRLLQICKRRSDDGKTCGLFMPSRLIAQQPGTWKFYCETAWDQLRETAPDLFSYYETFFQGRPVSEWPKIGCRGRYIPWAYKEHLCHLRLFDEHNQVTFDAFFLAHRPPAVIDEVVKNHSISFSKALNAMPTEELQNLLPNYYQSLAAYQWAPEGYPAVKDVGFFPFEEHRLLDEDQQAMTFLRWAYMLKAVALKDFDNLAPVWALGDDMLRRPNIYNTAKEPRASDFMDVDRNTLARKRSRSPEDDQD